MPAVLEIFAIFLRLGLTSFGGPVAHLGYFREEFVERRRWLSDAQYAELVALCQFLPGPASSQVGMAIGLQRGGGAGMAAAWIAFTLPSALLLVAFAVGVQQYGDTLEQGWLAGMKAAAVAVVAHAVLGMATTLAVGRQRATIAVLAMACVVLAPSATTQVLVIIAGGAAGWLWIRNVADTAAGDLLLRRRGRGWPLLWLGLFALLLAGLPLLALLDGSALLATLDRFYRAGALVFGGGHVVLPLLHAEVVETGMVTRSDFLAGYGAAQAVPGPLFTFAAYLGFVAQQGPAGVSGAVLALLAIFLPSALLVAGILPFWDRVRGRRPVRRALAGVNASVVGLLGAALWHPVLPEGAPDAPSAALALVAFALLAFWKLPAWAVVAAAAGAGAILL